MSQAGSLLSVLRDDDADCALPRTAIVAAHPDDEAVGAGSRLPRLAQARFIYVTDGAPADAADATAHGLSVGAYASVRRRELKRALQLCGIAFEQVHSLGYADQGVALRLPCLARDLADLFVAMNTEAVLTHAYEGGHPDHDATAFAVHAAAALLRRAGRAPLELLEMASYHMGAQGIRAGAFLPAREADRHAVVVTLDRDARQRKRALFDCHATQRRTLAYFPVDVECFRPSPDYDFLRPPHPGKLFYECQPWGMDGERFCALAAQAMAELALEGPL